MDDPHPTRLAVQIRAVFADHEREMISERTKAALAAAKRRGIRLGNPRLAKARKKGAASIRAEAKQFAANVLPVICEIQASGITTSAAIAAKLTERRVPTARAGRWSHKQVAAVLGREQK